jgi:hypothetical protein
MPHPLKPLLPGGSYLPAWLYVPERRLPPNSFIAHDGVFHHVPILSVEPEEGPRRIVFLEMFGKEWRRYARQWQGQAADTLWPELAAVLSAARPEDSFALLAVGGPRVEVPFGSSRAALRAAIEAMSHSDPRGPDGPDLFEGLLQAATWFGSPQTGDSIFEFGGVRRWRWDKARASQVRIALVSRGIRLFSLGGAYEECGSCDETGPLSGTRESPLLRLCKETGGSWETIGYLGPNAHDEMLWEWQNAAKSLYEMATFAYILRLARTGPHVTIQLQDNLRRLPWLLELTYPRPLPVCP